MMSSRKLNRFLPGRTSQSLIRVKSGASAVLAIQAQLSVGVLRRGPPGQCWARGSQGDPFSMVLVLPVSTFQFGICVNVGFIISYHRQASSAGQGDSVADCSTLQCQGVTLREMVNFFLPLTPERGHPVLGSLLGPGMEHLDFLDRPPVHPESASPETYVVGQEQ